MKMKVYRDKAGSVVNIGEWDYQIEEEFDGEEKIGEIITNPLPQDLVVSEEEVVVCEDGSKVVATEYQRLRALSYPRVEDQLDYIYHNGLEAWKTKLVQPIKDKYPKPKRV